ncbi:MAG TPA: hypothetical protein VHX38_02665 [Pseudonocardiaceae bacterium]|jgi:hypothetical protein|nr:hypothetical protein [Pseudonocardiaceae bacterium]
MVTTPPHIPGSQYDALQQRVARLEKALANLSNRTLAAAAIGSGGITIDGGSITFQNGGDINLATGGHIRDGNGNIVFSADGTTGEGLSTPFLSVPMMADWNGGGIRGGTDGLGEYLIGASHITTETELWRGIIPQVLHPNIGMRCVIGRASGATSTPTYRLYVNGALVDTFSQTTFGTFDTGQLDVTAVTVFGSENVGVSLTAQVNTTSTDQIACTCVGVFMCGR